MSVKLSAYVWDGCAAAGIKGNKLLIMLRLADYASDEGIAYPSVATIARQLGAGRSTVISLIGDLVKDGWLSKKERRQGQRSTSNLYTLNVAKLRQAAASEYSDGPKSGRPESEPPKTGRPESEPPKTERPEDAEKPASQGPETGHDPSVNSTTDPSDKSKPSCPVAARPDPEVVITDNAIEVLTHLNRVSGSHYQKLKTSLENIRARLREGYSVSDLQLVVDLKHEHWRDNDEQYQYMRPETLFGPKKFEGYLQSAARWNLKGRPKREDWGKSKKQADDSSSFSQDAGVDIAERDLAWRRYHGLEVDNEPKSEIEALVRVKADRDGLKAKGHDHGLAQFGWNNIWSVVAKTGRAA